MGRGSVAEYFGVTPDVITTAKGLTNGTIPTGAVIVDRKIYQSAMENADGAIELFPSCTYSAHPVATALASIKTYRADDRHGLLRRLRTGPFEVGVFG